MEVTEPHKTPPYQHPPYLCGMGDVGMEVVGMGVWNHVIGARMGNGGCTDHVY